MIKNIIFDFGDVFINLDKAATLRELNRLGLAEPKPGLLQLFHAYEKGELTTPAFLSQVKPIFPDVSEQELRAAWNAILLDLPEYRLRYLQHRAGLKSHRLFLLSNTNALHMEYVEKTMGTVKYRRFMDCFDTVYLSYKIKMRKPDPDIFLHVLKNEGLKPGETLFIDDNLENIRAAAALDIEVWHLEPRMDDIVDLDNRLSHD